MSFRFGALVRAAWMASAVGATLVAAPAGAIAGAWTQPQGQGYGKLSYNYFESDQQVTRDHEREDLPDGGRFWDKNISLYLDYGFTDHWTGFVSTSAKRLDFNSDTTHERNEGFGDLELALKYKIIELAPMVGSIQALQKIPTYDEDVPLPLGNGQSDTELRLLAGWSLYPLPLYAGLEAGYRFRTQEPSDEYKVLAELGWSATERLFLRAKFDMTISAKNGDDIDDINNPTATNEYDLYKVELTAGCKLFEDFALEVGWTPVLYGENTAYGHTFTVGISATFGGRKEQQQ